MNSVSIRPNEHHEADPQRKRKPNKESAQNQNRQQNQHTHARAHGPRSEQPATRLTQAAAVVQKGEVEDLPGFAVNRLTPVREGFVVWVGGLPER